MSRVKIKKKFFVFIVFLLLAAIAIPLIVLGSRGVGTIENGAIKLSMPAECILIRDEVSVSTEKFDKIIFKVPEAQETESGTLVAQIFKWGYNDEIMQSLLNVQKEILAQQMAQLEGIENPDLTQLNGEIDALLSDIRSVTMEGEPKDLLDLEWALKELMQRRIDYLKNSVQATETLSSLYAEEQNRIAQIEEWKSDIVTAGSGLVSFYFDGFEQVLCADKLNTLNADLIKRVLKGSKSTAAGSADNLYRLINSEHWYCSFITPSAEALRLAEDEEYTVVFEGYYDRPYIGRALRSSVSGNDVVNILEFEQDIGPLYSTRIADCVLYKEVQGLKVPLKSIDIKNGLPGINIKNNGGSEWIEVNVLAADDENAIISASDNARTLTPGTEYIKP
jgi:putative membrane fusion protein